MHPRKLARQVARAQLDRAGATGYNKKQFFIGMVVPSYFQRNWRNIARGVVEKGVKA